MTPRIRRLPRPRTLRARLTFGLVVLLAVGCAAVGVAAVLELDGFLTGRIDQQLQQAGPGFPESLEHGTATPAKPSDHDGDERGDTRRQAAATFGARLLGGTVTHAAMVPSPSRPGFDVSLTGADRRALAALRADHGGHTVRLSDLGEYRLAAWPGRDGDVLVTGLPMAPVRAAVHRLELVAGTVSALA
ncbi:two-component sensor histidine kinase, partial [Streptomyces sp. NPDC056291]